MKNQEIPATQLSDRELQERQVELQRRMNKELSTISSHLTFYSVLIVLGILVWIFIGIMSTNT